MDLLGRSVAQDLADKLGQQFVVDNRAGAAGSMARWAAAEASARRLYHPDGGRGLARAEQVHVQQHALHDPETELAPIVIISRLPHISRRQRQVEAKTLKELIKYAKANPGKVERRRARHRHHRASPWKRSWPKPGADDGGAPSRRTANAHRSGRRQCPTSPAL